MQIEHAKRRERLFEEMASSSIALLACAPVYKRNGDSEYPYRQDSDFYYLTGITEPESFVAMIKSERQKKYIIFSKEVNELDTIWIGPRIGTQGMLSEYGADEAYDIEDLEELLPKMILGCTQIYYPFGKSHAFDRQLGQWIADLKTKARSGEQAPDKLIDLQEILSEMRLIKSDNEIKKMQKAADITASAHTEAMKICTPGMMEYEIEAKFLSIFCANGARDPAYTSIVAGGKNACILHYIDNNQPLDKESLLLIDAGAEYDHYAADVTRTFPVSGKFTKAQQAVYEVVLHAQEAGIQAVKPGALWSDIQDAILSVMVPGLLELGLLNGEVNTLIDEQAYRPFYMHRSGHWLGLDVHDVGRYKVGDQWRPLEPGMVLTIEPGLYLNNESIPEDYRGIGVRIEDDILVTESGYHNLSQAAPKTVQDIQKVMSSRG